MKAIVTLTAVVAAVTAQTPGADEIRDRLDRYLYAYEPQLSSVVADEEMTQRSRGQGIDHRRIHSEVAFIALPGGAGWIGFRRVLKVNDKTVKDGGVPLERLMAGESGDRLEEARRLLTESAAHNLGAPRTINLPNLPLELLHPRHRHRFRQEVFGREKVRGVPTVVLQLEEIASPTIIQQAGDSDLVGDMKTAVRAWVEPVTGRLLRARVTARDSRIGARSFVAEVRVEFKHDGQVGMLVPVEMAETFFVHPSGSGTGLAKYTNYRQFRTSARIVPQ